MFGIQPGDELQITVEGACILLHKPQPGCIFCGGLDGLRAYRAKPVCRPCAQDLFGFDRVPESPISKSPISEAQGDVVDPSLGDLERGGNGG